MGIFWNTVLKPWAKMALWEISLRNYEVLEYFVISVRHLPRVPPVLVKSPMGSILLL